MASKKIIYPVTVLHALLFIGGWDSSAIDFFGFSIRLAWIILPFLIIYTPKARVPAEYFLYISFFFLLHIFSAIVSSSPGRGMIYSFWIIFSYYFFFSLSYRCAYQLSEQTFDIFILNGRIQILFSAILYFAGVHQRATFTYYEPSYMAVALIPYVALCFFSSKSTVLDYILIALFAGVSQSANFLTVIILFSLIKFYSIRNRKNFFLIGGSIIGLLFFGLAYLYYDKTNINHALVVGIIEGGINLDALQLLIQRGGNRVPRMEAAFDVFTDNIFLGVGPSNYINYTANMNFDYVTDGIEWIDPEGKPPTNAFLEAGLNAGIFSIVMLIGLFFYAFSKCSKIKNNNLRWLLISITLVIFLMLQLDSNYLRAYCWIAMGAVFGIFKRIANASTNERESTSG